MDGGNESNKTNYKRNENCNAWMSYFQSLPGIISYYF